MKRVLIVCGSGVTSSLIADELNKRLENQGYYIVNANISFVLRDYHYFDFILVAPQIKFMYKEIKALCDSENILCMPLAFNEYTTTALEIKIKTYLPQVQNQKLHIAFVKDDQSGYLAQLFIKKLEEEFDKNKYEVEIHLLTYSLFQKNKETYDYILFEPKLMFKMPQKDHYLCIRNSDYHTLNAINIVQQMISKSNGK